MTADAMRFAYADPPYPGQSKRLYGDHPDYAGEVDHADLIARLCRDYPDGWALSTSVEALRDVLILCPPDVRVAVWNVTNRRPFNGAGRWHQSWEPVITRGGRLAWGEGPCVRDLLTCGAPQGFIGNSITGQKPNTFVRWIIDLLGIRPDDELDDLFPGSGAVGKEWAAFRANESMPLVYSHTKVTSGWHPRSWPTLDEALAGAS
jgi:hypothetical protein